MDYETLESLRQKHPAWRLLCSPHAPLIASFLHRVFVSPNVRDIEQPELIEKLEDEIFVIHEQLQKREYPDEPHKYLTAWTEKGWLRKFYKEGSDEPYFDLTPSTEKAIAWLVNLTERSFVGTESRLLTLIELLKQIAEGTESDPDIRRKELERRRAELDAEIDRLWDGNISLLSQTGIKERFQQFQTIARELLSDFRQVEQNFRSLDRSAREQIARWEGGRGELLDQLLGERDQISDSDQGKSFHAFWDFLMSHARQDELTQLLEYVLALEPVAEMQPDPRLKRVHYEWIDAGEHTQKTVAQLSQQLRRFLDDTARLENKRIMQLLHGIESMTLDVRDHLPEGNFIELDGASAEVELVMDRPLYTPPLKPRLSDQIVDANEEEIDPRALFAQTIVDKDALATHIRKSLQERRQITLRELVERRPLEHGLAELIAYLELATNSFHAAIDEDNLDTVRWSSESEGKQRESTLPRVIFTRGK